MFKSFFYSGNKFQPVYAWITIFCLLVVIAVVLRLCNISGLSDGLILGLLGFIELWVLLYNINKKNGDSKELNNKHLDIKNGASKL